MSIALSGSDVITINNRVIVDLADGDCVELTFPNDIATVKVGKNGNTIYGLNEMGKVCDNKMRVIRGSEDDKFLNNLLIQQQNNFAGTVLLFAQFVKKMGDGQGNITPDTYVMTGGVFQKVVEAKDNVEGDAMQSVSVYMVKYAKAVRAIG